MARRMSQAGWLALQPTIMAGAEVVVVVVGVGVGVAPSPAAVIAAAAASAYPCGSGM